MAEDLGFELSILATVQGFYQKLMKDALGGDVPIPSGLDEDALRHSERELPNTLSRMYRWLHMLDMAITPAMLRKALTPDTDSEVAEALLRYFVKRREPSDMADAERPGAHGNPIRHAVQPTSDRLVIAHRLRLANQQQKRGLKYVFGVLHLLKHSPTDAEDHRAVPSHQRVESVPVAAS